jgi:hypothetical protein
MVAWVRSSSPITERRYTADTVSCISTMRFRWLSTAPSKRLLGHASARWVVYGVALGLVLLAGRAVDRPGRSFATAQDSQKSPAPIASPMSRSEPAEIPELDLARLARPGQAEATANLFGPSWTEVAAEEARRSAPPPPPAPPPQAPPLPFAFMGKLVDAGKTLVFLTRDDRNYVVRLGDTIDGAYRVDEIGEHSMTLTYLPLDSRQSLAVSSPAQAGLTMTASLVPAAAVPSPLAASAPPQSDPTKLVWRAPPRVQIGDEFTVEVGLPAGPQPRSGRVELIYDPRVLAVLGGAATGPSSPIGSAATRRAIVEVIGPGFPGAQPTPSEVRFRVLTAEPTSTQIAIENLAATTRAGTLLLLTSPPVHRLAVVQAQGSQRRVE